MQLIECVPNISEGRNKIIIDKIVDVVDSVDGVKLLNVDPGKATNRTVITFVGEPEKVIEAQLIESYVNADYLKYVHDYLLSLAKIDKLIGQEIK